MTALRTGLFLSSAAAAFTMITSASAQTAADTPETGDSVIVVTAQKREQTLIDVPASVSVVSGATLENQQATNFQDYLKLVPGLQLNQATPGFGRLVIRGINTGGVGATVGVYVDETPFGSSSGLVNGAILAGDFDTFDVSRIEVLRGPQGTLYGASSLAGVLKFVTNAPDTTKIVARARGAIETTKGGEASYAGNAVINLPISETIAVRASGTYRRNGGWIDSIGTSGADPFGTVFTARTRNDVNRTVSYSGRIAASFKPSETFDVRLSAILQNLKNDAPSQVDADPVTFAPRYGRETQSVFAASPSKISYRVYNGLVNLDLGGLGTLTSSSSYSTLKQKFINDVTFNLAGAVAVGAFGPSVPKVNSEMFLSQTTSVKKYTEELRLASTRGSLIDYLLGGYYTYEKGLIAQQYINVTPGTLNQLPTATFPVLADVRSSSRYEEVAGFANATLHLGDRVDIDAGGRYSHNRQSQQQVGSGPLGGGVFPVSRSSENVFTYSVAPKFKFGPNASIYGRVAKGFRPGGPNVIPPGAPAGFPATFDSDTLTNFEGGFKGQTPDRKFSIEVVGYHIDWSRIQLFAVVNGFGANVNGTSAKSDGVEFNVAFRPIRGFETSINGAYTRARLSGDTSPLVGGRAGDALPFTPKYSIGVNSDYRWDFSNDVHAFVGGSLRFLSKQSGAFDNNYRTANGRQRQIQSYDVVDLRAGFDVGRFELEVYAKNVTNAYGVTSTGALTANGLPTLPNGALSAGVIRPRTIGLSLTASY